MSREPGPVFLERRSYRRRRLSDAARLLPMAAAVLICLPLLWHHGSVGSEAGAGAADGNAPRTALVMLYLFGLWALLVVLAGLISRRLPAGDDDAAADAAAGSADDVPAAAERGEGAGTGGPED